MSLLQDSALQLCAERLDMSSSAPILAQAVFRGQAAFYSKFLADGASRDRQLQIDL
jgi:hypothetical protein